MSSRFSAKPAVPQPPPICRKSVPANYNPAWPAWRLSAWVSISAETLTQQKLKLNQTFSLKEIVGPGELYQTVAMVGSWTIDLLLVRDLEPARYVLFLEASHPETIFRIECSTSVWKAIKLKPFNSGYQPMDFLAGTGTAACQIRL